MAAVKARQQSIRELTAVKEDTFIKSFRNELVIDVEEWKESQAVHPSQDRHGSLEPCLMKTRPPGMSKDERRLMSRKASQIDCAPDERYKNDSCSAHDMRDAEGRRRGSQFRDLLIRPAHMMELDEKRRWSRSSLFGGTLDAGIRHSVPLENSKTGKFSQTRTKSFVDRRKSSVDFRDQSRRKSSLIKAIAFNRTSIMTEVVERSQTKDHFSSVSKYRNRTVYKVKGWTRHMLHVKRKGKSVILIDQEQMVQARRESKMDAMGTCTYVKVRHILSEKQGLMTDVYNQLQKGWLAFGNKVPPKDFGKLAEKYSCCKSSKDGGDLGWIARAKPGSAGPFQEVAFTTPVGAVSTVFQSSQGFHILMVEARKN